MHWLCVFVIGLVVGLVARLLTPGPGWLLVSGRAARRFHRLGDRRHRALLVYHLVRLKPA